MFQFPGLPLPSLCVQLGVAGNDSRRVAPFGAPHRGLSQLVTSFVGFQCQGIHRVPLPSSSRWFRYFTHRAGSRPRAIRCDLLEKENIVFVTLCSSQGTRGEPSRPDTAPRGATKRHVQLNRRAPALKSQVCLLLEEVFLPRKEVIQPHLPVRLPCYDFTPLTLHTFGTSLPRGLGRRLRVQTTRVV